MKSFFRKLLGIINLVAFDIFVIVLAFSLAMYFRHVLTLFLDLPVLETQDPFTYQLSNWWILPLYIGVFSFNGLYHKHRPFWQETKVLLTSIAITSLFVYSFISLGKLEDYISRTLFVMHPILIAIILPPVRRVIKSILYKVKYWQTQIIEIRVDTDFSLDMTLAHNTFIGYHIAESKKISLTTINRNSVNTEIKALLKKHKTDTLLVVLKELASPEVSKFIESIYFIAPHVLIVPERMDLDVLNADVHYMMGNNTFMFDIRKGLNSFAGRLIKRTLDIIISTIGIIFSSPIMLFVAIRVAIADGFPVLYNHDRYGKDGKIFTFHKFRSMKKEDYPDHNHDRVLEYIKDDPKKIEHWNKHQKLEDGEKDPRYLKGMKFIRKTSIDELPQLFNVLKGQMSIIGPRPYMPRERAKIGDYFSRIMAAKPGVTDLWTVNGRDALSFETRLKMSTWYVQNWTLWLDFIILMKTIQVVISYAFKWLKK